MAKYKSIFKGAEIDGRLAGVVADFDPARTYYVGDVAFHDNQVYRKKQNPGAGGWADEDWEEASVADGVSAVTRKIDLHVSELPRGYRQIEYIEVTGGQSFTGGPGASNQNSRVRVRFQLSDLGTNNYIFGSRSTTTSRGFWAAGYASGDWYAGYGASSQAIPGADMNPHEIDMDGADVYIDGSHVHTFATATFTTPYVSKAGAILGTSSGAERYYYGRLKIFRYTQWGGSPRALTADLVPAVRESDGAPGLFDLVSGTFSAGDNETASLPGPEISIESLYDEEREIRTEISGIQTDLEETNGKLREHVTKLPIGYTQIKCVVCTGEQSFIVGRSTSNNRTHIRCKFRLTDLEENNYIFGSRQTTESRGFWAAGYQNGSWRIGFGNSDKSIFGADLNYHEIELDQNTVRIDGNTVHEFPEEAEFATPKSARVGAINGYFGSEDHTYFGRLEIYGFTQWMDGELSVDYVPAIRDSDGRVGFFDIVQSRFTGGETDAQAEQGNPISISDLYETISANNADVGPRAYIESEADRVATLVRDSQGGDTITFIAVSDLHYSVSSQRRQAALEDMRYAVQRIAGQVKIDFFASFGDMIYRRALSTAENFEAGTLEMVSAIRLLNDAFGIAPQFRMVGNHDPNAEGNDGAYFTPNQLYSYTGIYSEPFTKGPSANGSYGYRDFERQKLRIIVLNTSYYESVPSLFATQYSVGDTQAQWFAETLDLSSKSDAREWTIMVFSHVALGTTLHSEIGKYTPIIDAYTKGGVIAAPEDSEPIDVHYNYAGKNAAKLALFVNGHAHKYAFGNVNFVVKDSPYWRVDHAMPPAYVMVPNALDGRDEESFNGITYTKHPGTAESTAFQVVTLNTVSGTAYFYHYGAGVDVIMHYLPLDVTDGATLETSFVDPVWSTKDSGVATVDSGTVTAAGTGSTMIYATGPGGDVEVWNVIVTEEGD